MSIYRIAKNGESNFHIVNHQYSDECVRYAASELQKYLLRATGAAVPYFSDRCPMRGPEIRIGADVRGETSRETDLCEDGFCIRAAGEHITITSSTSRGVLYGVYRFLEIFCNFRCFTNEVETIGKYDTLEIELDEIKEEPAFECRDAYFRHAFNGDFAAKNRLNASLCDLSVAKGGRIKWFNFHHSYRDLVPEEVYFEEHPEYFSEIDGKRERNSQICLTNPEVLDAAEATLRKWIKENPECRVFSVAQNDNEKRCTCEKCLALEEEEGSPAGPIIHFANALADRIKYDYPHVLIHTFAYQYSLPAPKKVVARDNIIVRLCSIGCRFDRPFETLAASDPDSPNAAFINALKDWQTHANRIYVWDYAVNFRNYCQPFVHLHVLKENVKMFRKLGIKGVLEQGNFAYGGGAALDGLKTYVISRLLWDPDTEYITDGFIEAAKAIFNDAVSLAETDEIRRRVEREYLSVRFLELARMPIGTSGRDELIDSFFKDVKSHGITEIRERRPHSVTKRIMKESPFMHEHSGYKLYYIMQ